MNAKARLTLPGRLKPYVMAHRGNQVLCPENTLAAFQKALEEGADILETDLQVASDGVLMCIHDATVDRTTDGQGEVAKLSLVELKRLSASYGYQGFAEERIPTLTELIEITPETVALALELKSDQFLLKEVASRLVKAIDRLGVRERTVMLSFSLPRLHSVRSIAPDIPIGWITMTRAWPLSGVDFLGPAWPRLVINPFYVVWAHLQGQMVCPLDPMPNPRLWYYRMLGCDAVLADDPGSTIQALKRQR